MTGSGATILVLVLLRLVLRLFLGVPVLPRGVPAWAEGLAHLNHRLMYLLLIAQPVIGLSQQRRQRLPVVDLRLLHDSVDHHEERGGGGYLKAAHLGAGTALIALILLHLLGAFYHAAIRRDGVMRRMI